MQSIIFDHILNYAVKIMHQITHIIKKGFQFDTHLNEFHRRLKREKTLKMMQM